MAELDEAARYALKRHPAEAVAWLLPTLDADLAFARWLDTQMIAFPGEPNRRSDTVAELVSRSGTAPPWALVIEVEAKPRASIRERILEYEVRVLRKLRHGPHRRDHYKVAAVVIFLSGQRGDLKVEMVLPGTDVGLTGTIRAVSLTVESAMATLERIGRGELGRSVLSWVPLMAGVGDEAVTREWVRLANEEADAQRRSDYAGIALVFANWVGHGKLWEKALEGWDVEQIDIVRRWKESARREGREQGLREGEEAGVQLGRLQELRSGLLKLLRAKFPSEQLADMVHAIEQQAGPDLLSRWFDAVLIAATIEEVRTAIQPPVPPPANGTPTPNGSH
jgi:hypothetical protein